MKNLLFYIEVLVWITLAFYAFCPIWQITAVMATIFILATIFFEIIERRKNKWQD